MEYKDPGRYIPIIYLLYSWGSQFGVPSRVPLLQASALRLDLIPEAQLQNPQPTRPARHFLEPPITYKEAVIVIIVMIILEIIKRSSEKGHD